MAQLYYYHSSDEFIFKLGALSIFAEMEKRILLGEFGRQFYQRIMESQKPWAEQVKKVLTENAFLYEPWETRKELLRRTYPGMNPLAEYIIPEAHLSRSFGLGHLAKKTIHRRKHPLEYSDLAEAIESAADFLRYYTLYRGIILGGVDNLWGINWFTPENQDGCLRAIARIRRRENKSDGRIGRRKAVNQIFLYQLPPSSPPSPN